MPTVSSIVGGSIAFVRNNVQIIAVWSVVYIVCGLLMSIALRPFADASIIGPEGFRAPSEGVRWSIGAVYLIFFLQFTILFAAAFRAVLTPADDRAAYLRVGMDELRLIGLFLIVVIGGGIATIVVGVVIGFIGVFLSVFAGGGMFATVLMMYLPSAVLFAWLATRLSAAAPLTVLRKRITIAEAWRLTRGHVWKLLGAYLPLLLLISIAFALFLALTMGSYFVAIANAMSDPASTSDIAREQMDKLAFGKPLWFVTLISGGVLYAVSIALQGAMTAIATRELLAARDE